jgi:hypothetical protein
MAIHLILRSFQVREQHYAEEQLAMLKVRHNVSYNVMSSRHFQSFTNALRSDFRVPCKATMQKRVTELYSKLRREVEQRLQSARMVSIAIDGWEDARHAETLAVPRAWFHPSHISPSRP